jgi:hypothetical protein
MSRQGHRNRRARGPSRPPPWRRTAPRGSRSAALSCSATCSTRIPTISAPSLRPTGPECPSTRWTSSTGSSSFASGQGCQSPRRSCVAAPCARSRRSPSSPRARRAHDARDRPARPNDAQQLARRLREAREFTNLSQQFVAERPASPGRRSPTPSAVPVASRALSSSAWPPCTGCPSTTCWATSRRSSSPGRPRPQPRPPAHPPALHRGSRARPPRLRARREVRRRPRGSATTRQRRSLARSREGGRGLRRVASHVRTPGSTTTCSRARKAEES